MAGSIFCLLKLVMVISWNEDFSLLSESKDFIMTTYHFFTRKYRLCLKDQATSWPLLGPATSPNGSLCQNTHTQRVSVWMPQSICHRVVFLSPHFSGCIRGHLEHTAPTQQIWTSRRCLDITTVITRLWEEPGRDTFPALSYLIPTAFVIKGRLCPYLLHSGSESLDSSPETRGHIATAICPRARGGSGCPLLFPRCRKGPAPTWEGLGR